MNTNITILNRWRVVAKMPLLSEPFVDWFSADSAEHAIAQWRDVAAEIGLPNADKAQVSASLGKAAADAVSTRIETDDDGKPVVAWTIGDETAPIAGGYCRTESDARNDAAIWLDATRDNPRTDIGAAKKAAK